MYTQNLLLDPLLSVRDRSGERLRLTLPDLLAHLGRGEEVEPLALRPHQHHAWHAFLVQLGALVAHRTGDRSFDRPPAAWRQALLDLAGEAGDGAWSLVVPDLSRPAFLQPPIPEGSLAGFRNLVTTPDELDVVPTARNHDVKAWRICSAQPEHWIYALLTLQTMEGYFGSGKYGIARMNTGSGSRPAIAAAPGLGWAERFLRDVGVWLAGRQELVELYGYQPSEGHALLWLLPWDGTTSRSLQECDPLFLEVCRRVRLAERDGRIAAVTKPTETAFLDAKERRGDTGDIWTPVQTDDKGLKALTLARAGLSYSMMADLLFGEDVVRRPALLLRQEDGKEPVVVAQVLVRGKGKTDGYRERLIPIPPRARPRLFSREGTAEVGGIARARIDLARTVQTSVLKPALCVLLQGGPEKLDFRDPGAQPWLDRFDAEVDQVFFPDLWEAVGMPREEHERAWKDRLRVLARAQLDHALEAAPVPLARLPRARAKAELTFLGAARRHLPTLDSPKETAMEEHS